MSSTEFIAFLPPPGDTLAEYDHHTWHDQQTSGAIPALFKDAMSVREEVYIKEQDCALENEVDEDDARSYHWISYASVGTTSSPPMSGRPSPRSSMRADSANGLTPAPTHETKEEVRRRSSATASRVPVATIRLVPPPHPPHPTHGPSEGSPHSTGHSPLHDDKEPYIKLGRLATLAPYRGLGLSRLLINTALEWAAQHPEKILTPPSAASREYAKLDGDTKEQGVWKGLVLVHAQTSVEKLWAKHGFERDTGMGAWLEEGIEHIGMWKRLKVKGGH